MLDLSAAVHGSFVDLHGGFASIARVVQAIAWASAVVLATGLRSVLELGGDSGARADYELMDHPRRMLPVLTAVSNLLMYELMDRPLRVFLVLAEM